MEIEAKYAIDDCRVFDRLLALRQVGVYTLAPAPAPEKQVNTYYDTADRVLGQQQFALRIRVTDTYTVATLKGKGSVADGIHRREEYEVPATNPNPATWTHGVARERALQLLQGAPLVPLVTIRTTRHIITATRDQQAVAEICLDQVTLEAGQSHEGFCELEIELHADGTVADLSALVQHLSGETELRPENRTKLQRGLALRDPHAPPV